MKERPILFSGEMVRAILDGRKTQTRRLCAPAKASGGLVDIQCPYGERGDRLWVRETWYCDIPADSRTEEKKLNLYFRADGEAGDQFEQLDPPSLKLWKPSIHMPRIFSRITLEIESVRVEQLQSISKEDAKAEGMSACVGVSCPCAIIGYEKLWDEINGKRAPWASNPWVWVIEFRRVDQ